MHILPEKSVEEASTSNEQLPIESTDLSIIPCSTIPTSLVKQTSGIRLVG